jgi:hypothetical protein
MIHKFVQYMILRQWMDCYVIKKGNSYFDETLSPTQRKCIDQKSASWWRDNPQAKVVRISLKEINENPT